MLVRPAVLRVKSWVIPLITVVALSDATYFFLKGVRDFNTVSSANLGDDGTCRKLLELCRRSLTNLARAYLLIKKHPLLGVSNPHYLISIIYDYDPSLSGLFTAVVNAQVEELGGNSCRAVELYVGIIKKLITLISLEDKYLDVSSRTYTY